MPDAQRNSTSSVLSPPSPQVSAAIGYLRRGWPVIPIRPREKRPLIDWEGYQHRLPTEAEVRAWFDRWPVANIGIVTGAISGIIALDVDAGADLTGNPIPLTPRAKTGRGEHFIFRHPGFPVPNAVRIAPGLDIRGDGGYIVAPPSVHPSGAGYQWLVSPEEEEPAACPDSLLALLKQHKGPRDWQAVAKGVPEGQRNETAASYGGKLLSTLPPELWGSAGWDALKLYAQRCQPPLDEAEARAVFENIAKREAAKRTARKPARVQQPIELRFPEEALTGIAGEFANLYAEYVEAPRSFLSFSFLTALGTLVGSKVTIKSELRPQPRLYTVLVGQSADARKSSAIKHTLDFFRSSIMDFPAHYGLGSVEGLAKVLSPDSTEKMVTDTQSARPLLLVFDELKVLVEKCKVEGSIALPMITSLFEANEFDNTTKTRLVSLRNAYLSVLAACTNETYESMWTPIFRDIGLLNRLWLVADQPTHRVALPKPVPVDQLAKVRSDLHDVMTAIEGHHQANRSPLELTLTPEAQSAWEAYYASQERTVHARRLDAYGLRLMLLLAVSEGELHSISKEIVDHTVSLLDWQLQIRRAHDPADAENSVAKLEELIRRRLSTGPKTRRELQRAVHANRVGIWVFNTALTNLQADSQVGAKDGLYFLFDLAESDPSEELSPELSPPTQNGEFAKQDAKELSSLLERETH